MLQAVASTRFGEAAEALESLGDPEVLLRLVGSVATAISAAEVLAALQKQTHAVGTDVGCPEGPPLVKNFWPRP